MNTFYFRFYKQRVQLDFLSPLTLRLLVLRVTARSFFKFLFVNDFKSKEVCFYIVHYFTVVFVPRSIWTNVW